MLHQEIVRGVDLPDFLPSFGVERAVGSEPVGMPDHEQLAIRFPGVLLRGASLQPKNFQASRKFVQGNESKTPPCRVNENSLAQCPTARARSWRPLQILESGDDQRIWDLWQLIGITDRNLLFARPPVLDVARVKENCFSLSSIATPSCQTGPRAPTGKYCRFSGGFAPSPRAWAGGSDGAARQCAKCSAIPGQTGPERAVPDTSPPSAPVHDEPGGRASSRAHTSLAC